jgi:hypothetical protein
MSSLYIKTSDLVKISGVTGDDFVPIVDSGSLTTYRVPITTINEWWDANGSASRATNADTASLAVSSSNSVTSSYSFTTETASYAITSSNALTASNSISASYSLSSSYGITSSYSLLATTASYAISSSNALTASNSLSSSYAITSSNAFTASYALTVPGSITLGIGFSVADLVISGSETIPGTVHMKCGEIILHNAAGSTIRMSGSIITLNTSSATPGPGGYDDTFSLTKDSWYDIWSICKDNGALHTAVLVPQPPGEYPRQTNNLPSTWTTEQSYTYTSYIGSVRLDPTTNLFTDVIENTNPRTYRTAWRTLPTSVGTSAGSTMHHSCSAIPKSFQSFLKCYSTSNGWAVGDIVPIENVMAHRRDDDWDFFSIAYKVYINSNVNTVLFYGHPDSTTTNLRATTKSGTGAWFTPSHWRFQTLLTF